MVKRNFKLSADISTDAKDKLLAICEKSERSRGQILERMINKFHAETFGESKPKPPAVKQEVAVTKSKVDLSGLQMSNDEISELKRIRKKNKGGAITQRVADALVKEFDIAVGMGYSVDEILTEWETRTWKSFKAEWLKPKGGNSEFSAVTQKTMQNLQGDW